MRYTVAGLCLVLVSLQAEATERWVFDDRIDVTGTPVNAVFHHLDGSGRKHIAASADAVAVVWEDNRSQAPQVYVTQKLTGQVSFSDAMRASDGSEAYEPAIAAITGNRFMLAFEQDGRIVARVLDGNRLGEPASLSQASASHASITSFGEQVYASWRERDKGKWSIQVAALNITNDNRIEIETLRSIENEGLQTPVLFPSIAANELGLCVAWEDRRAGHTRLLFSHSADGAKSFGEPQSLNEYLSNRTEYDKGNGVTRVSLATFGTDETLAAWMDKRRGGVGYGIFAALGDGESFGPNEKVHGAEGDAQPHYNPATAGNLVGDYVIAWDDFRRGDSDIWISTYNDDLEWTEDHAPSVASGSGEQSHPAIALDQQRNLHMLWIERNDMDGPSRLWYSLGRVH